MNDLDLFRAIGEALYGPLWQSEFARQIGVNDRTMRRWATGAFGLPTGIFDTVLPLVADRQDELADLRSRLDKLTSTSTSSE